MKDGWSIKTLKEVCLDFIVPQRDKPTSFDGDIPWCRIEDIEGRYLNGSKSGKMVTHELAEKMNMHLCPKGTVISACSASIGNQAITTVDCYTNQTFIGLVADPKILNNIYLYYFLESQKSALCELGMGATIKYISQDKYKRMQIPIPSLSEQQRIVDILDEAFEKIDVLKANAEQNLQDAKALFQAALREELEPKDGWKTVCIGDIAEIKGGKRVPKGYKLETTPTGYPYIRVADFNENGSVDTDDIHYISKEVHNAIKRYIITTEDIYISIAGTIGKSGIIPEELNGANLTENACRLVLKGNLNNKYIYYCTINKTFKKQISKLTMQAAQPKLAITRLATATLNIPSRKDQDRIVEVLNNLNDRCKALQTNYDKTLTLCDDLKQALLRKAFNGEL